MNSAIWCIAPPDSDLRRLRTHAAMRTFRIDKLCQYAAEVLLLGRHGEQHALGVHVSVKSLNVGDSETQFDFSCRILVRRRMRSESGLARRELAPTRRFELQL